MAYQVLVSRRSYTEMMSIQSRGHLQVRRAQRAVIGALYTGLWPWTPEPLPRWWLLH